MSYGIAAGSSRAARRLSYFAVSNTPKTYLTAATRSIRYGPPVSVSSLSSSISFDRPFDRSARRLNTSSDDPAVSDEIAIKSLSTSDYETVSEEDMETLHENVERLCEEFLTGAEVEYSSGVMTLKLSSGTYVINKQPPNQQIWMSSPFSGPARFGYSPEGIWVHHRRKGVTLGGLLDEELKALLGEKEGDWDGTGLK